MEKALNCSTSDVEERVGIALGVGGAGVAIPRLSSDRGVSVGEKNESSYKVLEDMLQRDLDALVGLVEPVFTPGNLESIARFSFIDSTEFLAVLAIPVHRIIADLHMGPSSAMGTGPHSLVLTGVYECVHEAMPGDDHLVSEPITRPYRRVTHSMTCGTSLKSEGSSSTNVGDVDDISRNEAVSPEDHDNVEDIDDTPTQDDPWLRIYSRWPQVYQWYHRFPPSVKTVVDCFGFGHFFLIPPLPMRHGISSASLFALIARLGH